MKSFTGIKSSFRILWAITANDLLAVIKNMNALTAFLVALFMVVFYRYYPTIMSQIEPPNVLVYDAGNSELVAQLKNSEVLSVYTYPSVEAMKHSLSNGDVPEIGLVVPAGFDQALESGSTVALPGYVMNWVSQADAREQEQLVEGEIYRLTGHTVDVQAESDQVYPGTDSHGLPVTVGISLIYVILMTPLPMLPHLFLEEKKSRTMDALRVSPASAAQIVTGKALSSLFYCLLGAVISLVIYRQAIIHWDLMILAVLSGSILVVAIGLWLGLRVENRGQMTMMVWFAILPLLLPVFLSLMEALFPAWLVQASRLIPTITMFQMYRYATVGEVPWQTSLLGLSWISAWAGIVLALVVRQVRRMDRQDEPQADRWLALFKRQKPKPISVAKPIPVPQQDTVMISPNQAQPHTYTAEKSAPPSTWRMIWTITVKDLRAAIKNKIFLSILLGGAVIASANIFLPRLIVGQSQPLLVIYDPGSSTFLDNLAGQSSIRLSMAKTQKDMENVVTNGTVFAIGVVAPVDFDLLAASGKEIVLEGYLSHTTDLSWAEQVKAGFEQQLSQAAGSQVRIAVTADRLYPSLDTFGQPAMFAEILVTVIFMLGAALIPLLFIEEKETHTLDALLVSPAGFTRIITGKALAGAAYCLAAAVVMLALNRQVIVHWEIIALAVLLTTFFAVAVGLLIGILANNPTTAGSWGGLITLILIGLTVLALLDLPAIPSFLRQVLNWLPGAASLNLFRLSMVGEIPAWAVWANANALLIVGMAGILLVFWRIRRMER